MQTGTIETDPADPADPAHRADQADLVRWVKHGVIGGVLAGILFALFEMVMATVQSGSQAFFMPLRMIGGIALGSQALEPSTSLLEAGGIGIAVDVQRQLLAVGRDPVNAHAALLDDVDAIGRIAGRQEALARAAVGHRGRVPDDFDLGVAQASEEVELA